MLRSILLVSGSSALMAGTALAQSSSVNNEASTLAAPVAIDVIDMRSLAECAVKNNPGLTRAYLQVFDIPSIEQAKRLRMMSVSLTSPPCTPSREIKVVHDKFARLVRKALVANRAAE